MHRYFPVRFYCFLGRLSAENKPNDKRGNHVRPKEWRATEKVKQ